MMDKKSSWIAAAIVGASVVAIGSYVALEHGVPSDTGTEGKTVAVAMDGRINGIRGHDRPDGLVMPSQEQRSTESSRLWAEYRASKVGSGAAGGEIIGTIAATGFLPSTRSNVNEALSFLRSNITREEKVKLLDLLGVVLYWNTSDPSIRADIARGISAMALESDDKEIVNAATLAYTRLEYFPDALKVLDRAYKLEAITQQDYYGEMAHMIVGSPSVEQLTLLRNIEAGKNDYSRDVLISTLMNPAITASLSPPVKTAAASLLAKWEPDLGDPQSGFGAGDGIVWGNWLGSSVALGAQLSGEPERVVMAKLLKVDESADPRKLVVALWTEPSAETVKAAFDSTTLARIDAKLAAYAASYPDSADIQGDVQAARRNLARVKQN